MSDTRSEQGSAYLKNFRPHISQTGFPDRRSRNHSCPGASAPPSAPWAACHAGLSNICCDPVAGKSGLIKPPTGRDAARATPNYM